MPKPNNPQTPPSSKAEGHAHEHSDVWVKGLFIFVFCLAAFGIGLHFILAGMLGHLHKTTPPERDPLSEARALAARPVKPPANWPRLQLSPPADLKGFRAREEAELNNYGWIDQSKGIVQIPIQQAMELLVKNHLVPVRTNNPPRTGKSPWELEQDRAARRKPGSSEMNIK